MNEPVAWMETYKGEPNNLDWDKNNLYCEGEFHNVVPLYTHQYERPHNTVLVPCDKLAEMQAEIERLIMLCDCMTTESNRKGNEIEALKQIIDANNLNQNIGQFVKPTNEPVAWMVAEMVFDTEEAAIAIGKTYDDAIIPLYTHQVKEQDTNCQYCKQGCIRCDARKQLTDEEIKAVYGEYFDVENCDWLHLECIRAILRKAHEK